MFFFRSGEEVMISNIVLALRETLHVGLQDIVACLASFPLTSKQF